MKTLIFFLSMILLIGCEKPPIGISNQTWSPIPIIKQVSSNPIVGRFIVNIDTVFTIFDGQGTTINYKINITNSNILTQNVKLRLFASGPNLYSKSFELDWRNVNFDVNEIKQFSGLANVQGIVNSFFDLSVDVSYDMGRTWYNLYTIKDLPNDDDY